MHDSAPVDLEALPRSALLKQRQVEAITGLTAATFEAYRLRGAGGPVFVRLGRAVRYRVGDVLDWIERSTVRA